MTRAAVLALACALAPALAACGDDAGDAQGAADAGDPDAEPCDAPAGNEVYFDSSDPCRFLSSYRFFTDLTAQAPNDRVVPYELTSGLFSDYADKQRFLWLPPGTAMQYDAERAFDVPVGAAILKTFGYDRPLETRILYRDEDGWSGLTYVYENDASDARLKVAGARIDVSARGHDLTYIVPNVNQCKECHEETLYGMGPVGPKARHLNRDFDYGDGPVNQLVHLTDVGYLTGAPADPAEAPRAAAWDDEASGTLDERARAYLDINCAHCHNPEGRARTSGLDLLATQTDPLKFGVCKPPVAAGGGSGDRQYNVVPGDPDASILVFRMESNEPDIQMPELGRTIAHDEGVALIRSWIEAMQGTCD